MSILCYHAIEDGWTSPLAVPPEEFEAHCAWLTEHRNVVTLDDAVTALNSEGTLPRGMVALTFDDGFASIYEEALPILLRYGLPATVFVVAQTLSASGQAVDWVDTPPPYPMHTLSPGQLLQLRDAGIAIGSHSWAHRDLRALTPEECVADLLRSRRLLETLLDQPVRYLAYPRGLHNDGVREAAARSGYAFSFALPEGRESFDSHAVARVGVHPGNGLWTLRVKTSSRYLTARTGWTYACIRKFVHRPLRRQLQNTKTRGRSG